jgi:hypothetical protein
MATKMTKKKKAIAPNNAQINENSLFTHISKIIEKRKNRAGMYANREVTLMYWEIGRYIGSVLLGGGTCRIRQKDSCDTVARIGKKIRFWF